MSLELATKQETGIPDEEPEGAGRPPLAWPPEGNYASAAFDVLSEAGNQAFDQAEICEQIEGLDSQYTQALYKTAGRYLIEANIALKIEGENRENDTSYPRRLVRIGQSVAKQAAVVEESEQCPNPHDPQAGTVGRREYLLELAQSYAIRALAPKEDPTVSMAGGTLPPRDVAEIVVMAAVDAKHALSSANDAVLERMEEKGIGAVIEYMDRFNYLPTQHRLQFVSSVLDRTERRVEETGSMSQDWPMSTAQARAAEQPRPAVAEDHRHFLPA